MSKVAKGRKTKGWTLQKVEKPNGGELNNKIIFYNVFWATRSKTTPLPAAPNRARGIDTLDEFYW
jgi:hypothetical protein